MYIEEERKTCAVPWSHRWRGTGHRSQGFRTQTRTSGRNSGAKSWRHIILYPGKRQVVQEG